MEIRRLTDRDAESYRQLRQEALEREPHGFHGLCRRASGHDFGSDQESPGHRRGQFCSGRFYRSATDWDGWILSPTGEKIRHRGGIWGVYVSEECRGKGVGRALLGELIGLVQLLPGMEQVALAVSRQNAAAKSLYESLGFEVYGCERRALKIGDEYVDEELMVLYFKR